MTEKKVILISGVADFWGQQVANRLLAKDRPTEKRDYHVIGYDSRKPDDEIRDLDFIQGDIRNPLFVELLRSERVDTVCHLVFLEKVRHAEAAFDINVMGTMKLLGACAEAGVRKVVLKSSISVYGAHPGNPAFIKEDYPIQGNRMYGYNRHQMEIEAFCNGFSRQVPEMILTILRFAHIIGPNADTPMTRFLIEPAAPVLLGFDPLMQVIHEKDVVEALVHAIQNDVPGTFNVAAEGIMPLSRLTALAGKLPLPVFHLCAYWGAGLVGGMGLRTGRFMPIELDYLRYSCVGDQEKFRAEFGFVPRYTAEEALREFAGEQRLRRYMPESISLAYDEERLRDTMERRRRAREMEAPLENKPGEDQP